MSHFSDIGFNVRSQQDMVDLARIGIKEGIQHKTEKGVYIQHKLKSGIELWSQFDNKGALIGLNPHFHGISNIEIHAKTVPNSKGSILDGSYSCEIGEEPDNYCYPLYVDSPNFYMNPLKSDSEKARMQITAFADEIKYFSDEKEFSKATAEHMIAPQAFIPTGLFTNEKNKFPEAHAMITGKVLQSKRMINEISKNPFYWLLIETFGATYDVVADMQFFEKEPIVGGTIYSQFWLSGMILS